ncbi:hypothetical protein STA3757_46190 [Stanieria sp. NIES-3757]|nr:hypothetical protein STA3757_46190 [Stanieria sp. NIES-3757]
MTLVIELNNNSIDSLDLTPANKILNSLPQDEKITDYEQKLQFKINYQREETDPRELSEIPEIRLWFIRLDTAYPWLPYLLDWKTGELARYSAMLVPHQFSRGEGIIYNPEALEIFVMQKIFAIAEWLQQKGISSRFRLKSMAQILGYDLDDSFFDMLE